MTKRFCAFLLVAMLIGACAFIGCEKKEKPMPAEGSAEVESQAEGIAEQAEEVSDQAEETVDQAEGALEEAQEAEGMAEQAEEMSEEAQGMSEEAEGMSEQAEEMSEEAQGMSEEVEESLQEAPAVETEEVEIDVIEPQEQPSQPQESAPSSLEADQSSADTEYQDVQESETWQDAEIDASSDAAEDASVTESVEMDGAGDVVEEDIEVDSSGDVIEDEAVEENVEMDGAGEAVEEEVIEGEEDAVEDEMEGDGAGESQMQAVDFELANYDGQMIKLSDFDGKVVVLEWMSTECPFVKYHYDQKSTMKDLAQKWQDQGVVWLAINSTNNSDAQANSDFAKAHDISYPILDDSQGIVGTAYSATRTPEIFVIDKNGVIVYHGAIDNAPMGKAVGDYINYADRALNELAEGKSVSVYTTQPYGCSVKYAP